MWRGFDDSPRPWLARSLSGSATRPSQKRATTGERGSALRPNLLRHVNFPPGGTGPQIAEIFRTFPGEGVRLATLWQDLDYAFGMLRRCLGFTAIAVLTLAPGSGANTAVSSVVSGVLLWTLPDPEPGQVVRVFTALPIQPPFPLAIGDFSVIAASAARHSGDQSGPD
jgi:hypothetical protein